MNFRNPTALLGLIFAATPVAVYLLLRRRKRQVPWGASYLLRLTLASRRRSSRWKQFLVLALRVLILALMALLIARPWLPGKQRARLAPTPPAGPVHRVVLVDNTLSMSLREGDVSRLDRLKTAVAALLRSQRPGDRLTLLSLAGGAEEAVEVRDEPSEARVREVLAGLVLREGEVQFGRSAMAALERLSATVDAARELYILSDFPRDVAEQFERLQWMRTSIETHDVRVVAVNMSAGSAPPNVAVLEATIGADVVPAGLPVMVHVRLRNYADAETTGALELSVDDEPAAGRVVSLQPSESADVAVPVTFPRAGTAVLTVRSSHSPLDVDTSARYAVWVAPVLKVWVHGDEADPTSENKLTETEFLMRALDERVSEEPVLQARSVELFDLSQPLPSEVDVVVLAGPRVVTPKVGRQLMEFVRRGGGLIIAMSPKVDPDFYRTNLKPLLPALPTRPARGEVDPETFAGIRQEVGPAASALLHEFQTDRNGELSEVRVYNHYEVDRRSGDLVLTMTDGAPLLMHQKFGRGHVYLLSSSLGVSWSSLPVRQVFIPFVHRLVNAAARGRTLPRNVPSGATLIAKWADPTPPTVTTPAGETAEARLVPGPRDQFAVLEDVKRRGLYRMSGAGAESEAFTVQGIFPEGELRTVTAEQAERLAGLLGSPIYADWAAAVGGAQGAPPRPLWPWLLCLMLVLYALETWIVRTL